MVGELKGSAEVPALVQTGLLWWKPDKYVLQPFVGIEQAGGRMQTLLSRPLPTDSAQEHEFRITRTRTSIQAYMDSTQIFVAPWNTYFSDGEHLYLRVAAEVLSRGDAVSGTVRDIGLATEGKVDKPYLPAIADEDRALIFTCKDYRFVATGTFEPKENSEPKWFRPLPCEVK